MAGEIVTGLLHIDADKEEMHDIHNTSDMPLNQIPYEDLCPGKDVLQAINDRYR